MFLHPDLFSGLGTITGKYHTSLYEGAKPFVLLTSNAQVKTRARENMGKWGSILELNNQQTGVLKL